MLSTADVINPTKKWSDPWWLCPSDRELTLRSKISMGYSTVGSRLANNKHSPILGPAIYKLTEKDISTIEKVLTRAKDLEKANQIRSELLMMEYEQLKNSCRGEGIIDCIVCGYDPLNSEKKLQLLKCAKCAKIACSTCYKLKTLLKGDGIILCKLCYDYQELWCKTGSWMTDRLPKKSMTEHEIENYNSEEKRKTRGSIDILGSIQLQIDHDYLTHEDDDETDDEMNTSGAYKNVKFFEANLSGFNTPSPTPLAIISDLTERNSSYSEESTRQSNLEVRSRGVSSDNRQKLSEIRNKVKAKIVNDSTLSTPSVAALNASFDSADSDYFEPLKIHESVEVEDESLDAVLSTPLITDSDPVVPPIKEHEEERTISSLSDPNFEYEDVNDTVSSNYSFARFGVARAPIRIASLERNKAENDVNAEIDNVDDVHTENTSPPVNDASPKHTNTCTSPPVNVVSPKLSDNTCTSPPVNDAFPPEHSDNACTSPPNVSVVSPKHSDNTSPPVSIQILRTPSPIDMDSEMDTTSGVLTGSPPIDLLHMTEPTDDGYHGDILSLEYTKPDELGTDNDKIVRNDELAVDNEDKTARNHRLPVDIEISIPEPPLSVEKEINNDDRDDQKYRWKRRNARRTTEVNKHVPSDENETANIGDSSNHAIKREKARLAAKRVRQGASLSRSKRYDDSTGLSDQPDQLI